MTRDTIFEAIRAARTDKTFDTDEVLAIDALLDKLAVPRVDGGDDWLPIALSLIKQFEGCAKKRADGRYDAYPDPGSGGDPWTIGWGSTGAGIAKGLIWTQAEADARLAYDVVRFAKGVDAALNGSLATPAQKAALVSFAYNVGLGALQSSTLLRKHRDGDYAGAAAEFAKWNKAAGNVMAGLTRRRAAEAAEYAA